jgi:hypothetical protein
MLRGWTRPRQADLPPPAFVQTPTLDEVAFAVNTNTDRVHQFQTDSATLRVTDADFPIPPLRANIAFEKPRNFRLLAQLSQFTGREIDLGSNGELFWFWARLNEQPGVYFARHEEFATSPARNVIPIEPDQLVNALGLVRLEPQHQHSTPTPRNDVLEVRSQLPSPRGNLTRVLLLDAKYGWMVEQHLYDVNGQLILSAKASEHRFYRDDGISMPHHVEVRLAPGQPTQLAFELDVNRYLLNAPAGSGEKWALPRIDGHPAVNIADPSFYPPVAALPYTPPELTQTPAAPAWAGSDGPVATPYMYGPGMYGPGSYDRAARDYRVAPRVAGRPDLRGYQ